MSGLYLPPGLTPNEPSTGTGSTTHQQAVIDDEPTEEIRPDGGSTHEPRPEPDPRPRPPGIPNRAARLFWGIAATLVVAASIVGGYIAGSAAGDRASDGEVATVNTSAGTIADTGNDPTTLEEPSDPMPSVVMPPSSTDGDLEPTAAAAAVVSPSVVQIEVNGGLGSGVVYGDGLVLTAAHVVDGVSDVTLRRADGSTVGGRVLGTYEATDIAVVEPDEPIDVPSAVLATDTEPVVGQLTVAVGSPFGLDQTVTAGILSASVRTVNNVPMLQTDAAINPGNSGGPLVDSQGHVIGINDAIFTSSGGNEGVGFAIPIDLAVIVADQIEAGTPVQLALLGVTTGPPENDAGVIVVDVSEGSGADEAGLTIEDRIIAVNDQPVRDPSELRGRIITERPGTEIEITVVRDGRTITLQATLGRGG